MVVGASFIPLSRILRRFIVCRIIIMENNLKSSRVLPKMLSSDPSDSYILSPEQRQYYEDNGFLVIKELVDFASLYSYKQRFLQISKGVVPKGFITVFKEPSLVDKMKNPEDYVNKLQEILYDDVFVQYAYRPRLLQVLTQLIGNDVTAIHSMFINKPPGTGRHPPHQDLYYFPFRPADKIVASWTAVDHVTLDNGCLYVIPGSHKHGEIWIHGDVKDAHVLYHGIVDEETVAPLEKRVHLEMSPGDTVFFHPCLVHGSGPNVSKNYRKAITFHFANSNCECIDVTNTVQEKAAKEIEQRARMKGMEMSFSDIWRFKSRHIHGVKSKI